MYILDSVILFPCLERVLKALMGSDHMMIQEVNISFSILIVSRGTATIFSWYSVQIFQLKTNVYFLNYHIYSSQYAIIESLPKNLTWLLFSVLSEVLNWSSLLMFLIIPHSTTMDPTLVFKLFCIIEVSIAYCSIS